MTLTFGSLFAGIGGIDLGLERAGMTCKWQVEIDDFAIRVLEKHWPDVARFRDVRDCGYHNLKSVDLIAGGFPCQDISNAGKREGIKGKRSGLWSEFYRIICELRPRYVLVENVAALLVRGMGTVLGDLAACGYDAEWDCISAQSFGAVHKRERVFIVAYADGARLAQRGNLFIQSQKENVISPKDQSAIRFTDLATREYLSNPRDWPCKSIFLRKSHGLPNRMDRVRTLGNAVVPQVAEWIGQQIIRSENNAQVRT